MDRAFGERLFALREKIVADFHSDNWEEIGLLTACSDLIDGHPRLLRSLSWGDEDYSGNVLSVLKSMAQRDPSNLDEIDAYISKRFQTDSVYISAKPSEKKITFAPNVFQIPDDSPEIDLASVMMPFQSNFGPIYNAIKRACLRNGLRCLRADDIWDSSTIIQDIFTLLYKSQVVIVDFSGKNPNVMYETGIAHTLGKHVIPIAQSMDDVPFDVRHHRALIYLPNSEGIEQLYSALSTKLQQFSPPSFESIFQ
jgi:hypothetical protein